MPDGRLAPRGCRDARVTAGRWRLLSICQDYWTIFAASLRVNMSMRVTLDRPRAFERPRMAGLKIADAGPTGYLSLY